MSFKDKLIQILSTQKPANEFQRIEFIIDKINLLPWLAHQKFPQKIYWNDRKTKTEIAGSGCADCIHTRDAGDYFKVISLIMEKLSTEYPGMRYFGGFNFANEHKHDLYWQNFGKNHFILPRFEIIRHGDEFRFAMNFKAADRAEMDRIYSEIDVLAEYHEEIEDDLPFLLNFKHYPEKADWDRMINSALREISDQDLEKIVLARKSKLQFSDKINAFKILENLKQLNPDSTHFCIQPDVQNSFIGGTPELLYKRVGERIFSVAIAGTRRRGTSEGEDEQLENELLSSEKDLREHRIVIDNVRDILCEICTDVKESSKLSVLKLARVQHLYMEFEGKLKSHFSDIELISKLHPTPAVGGYPTEKAIQEITRLEPFKRGWYAAPVGWISATAAHFVVAIRSGLIFKNDLYLYSGAGIVAGSDADLEWEEIENKLANFLRAINVNGEVSNSYTRKSAAIWATEDRIRN